MSKEHTGRIYIPNQNHYEGPKKDPYDLDLQKYVEDKAPASPGGSSYLVKTYAELVALINAGGLVAGTLYKISDRGDRGLFFTAISVNKLAKVGTRLMLCPARYSPTEILGGNVWKGVWHISKNPDVGDLMIWGGKVWKSLTGNIGTATNNYTLDATNWVLIPKESFGNNEYVEMKFGVNYDIQNDWVEKQWDDGGNVFGISYNAEITGLYSFGFNLCDVSDWNYDSYSVFSRNTCLGFFNNNIGGGSVYNNSNLGIISRNSNPNMDIYNNYNSGDIKDNVTNEIYKNGNSGAIINNSNTNGITFNNNSGRIEGNSNVGQIYSNRCAGIINNSNNGDIAQNICASDIDGNSNNGNIGDNSNNGGIQANTNTGGIIKNNNAGNIITNSNVGYINLNSNGGHINNNSSGVSACNIFSNINNGSISGIFVADVNDTVVNKN